MENNKTWRKRFYDKFTCDMSDVDLTSFQAWEIESFIAAELLTLADKIGAEKKQLRDKHPNDGWTLEEKQIVSYNIALDTAISIIKEMAK